MRRRSDREMPFMSREVQRAAGPTSSLIFPAQRDFMSAAVTTHIS